MANSTHDMTTGSPLRCILRFAIPLIAGYILQQMYIVIDAALVGHWLGVNALAAVGGTFSVMFLIMGFCNGICAGFAIPVAQSFGAKDFTLMRRYAANALRLSAVIALLLTLVTSLSCTQILQIVRMPVSIHDDAYTFLFLQFLSIPFTIAYNLLACMIRALGNSKQPFYFLIFTSLLNIALDLILIIGMGMGVAGVGFATMIAQAISAWLCWMYIRKEMKILVPTGCERMYDRQLSFHLLHNGVPMGLQFSITGIGIIMLQSSNNALGTIYVASFTAAMRVKYLFTSVFENIGVAMATFCGQNIGAGQSARITKGIRAAIIITLTYFLFTVVIIQPFADKMMLLFVDSSETAIIHNAAQLMRICCWFYPVLGLLTILRYSIQGLGRSNLSMWSGVMEMLARSGVSLWLVPAIGYLGVCYGDPVAWIAADLFLIPTFWILKKKDFYQTNSVLRKKM